MPANIAFYSDALTSGRYGLGRYAGELLRALQRHAGQVSVRPVSAHVSLGAEELQSLKQDHGYKRLPLPRKIIAGLWSKVNWPRLEQFAPWADVVHCVELDYRVATRKPLIVTIHDLGPLTCSTATCSRSTCTAPPSPPTSTACTRWCGRAT